MGHYRVRFESNGGAMDMHVTGVAGVHCVEWAKDADGRLVATIEVTLAEALSAAEATAEVARRLAAPTDPTGKPPTCRWVYLEDDDGRAFWPTACGHQHLDDRWSEFAFCPYCGRKMGDMPENTPEEG